MGLQIGSPSKFTSAAGFALKNTAGGSAFTPAHIAAGRSAGIDAGQHAIERDDALFSRDRIQDVGDHALQLFFWQGRKVRFPDRELREIHQTLGDRDAGVGSRF